MLVIDFWHEIKKYALYYSSWTSYIKVQGSVLFQLNYNKALGKIPKIHLVSWFENVAETHSFHRVAKDLCETLSFSTKYRHQKFRWNFVIACSEGYFTLLLFNFFWNCFLPWNLFMLLKCTGKKSWWTTQSSRLAQRIHLIL